jgi:hippurate hydrolase
MQAEMILQEAHTLEETIISSRRFLHEHPGTGFDTAETLSYVTDKLREMGYDPKPCGRAGIVALAGGKRPGKVFLLRADMDALPMQEESGVDFSSKNTGKMHACGHDMHTAMLLAAARILKAHEDEICGTIKLMFQSAEEIFEGSRDMIREGVLTEPAVDAALMIHVMAGMPMPAGSVIVCDGGISAPGADYFSITIQGKGCHGSMPNAGIDPINAAAHIVTALQELHARELALTEEAVLTIGTIHGGNAANVIPDSVELGGTIRTYDEAVRAMLKTRMTEISQGIASAFRATASVSFGSGCPCLKNDDALSRCTVSYTKELLGERAFSVGQLAAMSGGGSASKSAGSEDFAYVSQEVPSIMLALAAGDPGQGYVFPQHHPQVRFDERALADGCAVYAYVSMRWLEEHA